MKGPYELESGRRYGDFVVRFCFATWIDSLVRHMDTEKRPTAIDIPSTFDSAWTCGSLELLARAWFVVLLGGHSSF
jgi:hypothetical protein